MTEQDLVRGPRSRGTRVVAVAVAALVLLSGCSVAAQSDDALGDTVSISTGTLQGESVGDTVRSRGIPYAAPPVGDLRWAGPEAPEDWDGTRDATKGGDRCVQPVGQVDAPAETPASDLEDCLVLAVTAPSRQPVAGSPVIVWIHGGGFSTGSGEDYDPRGLVEKGAVVVTVNYRLGVLGFLGLAGRDDGNYGLLDQIAALQWVQREIGAFGGDPDRVAIAGDSAGGDSVCGLLTSPVADGLFAAAIMQSPGCGSVNVTDAIVPGAGPGADTWKDAAVTDSLGAAFATAAGCPEPGAALACLRAKTVDELVAVEASSPIPTYWSPSVGTPALPVRPSEAIAAGDRADVPVLISTTQDEGAFFVSAVFGATPLDSTAFGALLAVAAAGDAASVASAYDPSATSPNRAWANIVTDRAYSCPAIRTAGDLARDGDVHLAEFAVQDAANVLSTLTPDLAGTATHGSDVPYLLELSPGQPTFTDQDARVAEILRESWVRFAATGDPDVPDGSWASVEPDGEATTITSAGLEPTSLDQLKQEHRCELWAG